MEHECLGILHTQKQGEEFYIMKLIGQGQYSRVYLSIGKDDQQYAIKIFNAYSKIIFIWRRNS